jgi:hypothetical protein
MQIHFIEYSIEEKPFSITFSNKSIKRIRKITYSSLSTTENLVIFWLKINDSDSV